MKRFSILANDYVETPDEVQPAAPDVMVIAEQTAAILALEKQLRGAERACAVAQAELSACERECEDLRSQLANAPNIGGLRADIERLIPLLEEDIALERQDLAEETSDPEEPQTPMPDVAGIVARATAQLLSEIAQLRSELAARKGPARIEFDLHRDGADMVRKITANISH